MANHEAIYRGNKVMDSRSNRQLVVFGVGAIGSLLVDHLARIGFKKLSVYDKDRVDADNVYSQIYHRKEQGQLKVDAMKNRIFLATNVQIETDFKPVSRDNISKIIKKYPANSVFVDCFDNEESRRVLFDNLPNCLHVGLSQDYAEVCFNDKYRVPKRPAGIDVCEYPQARTVTLIAVGIAAEVICTYVETGTKRNLAFTLGDLKIGPY